MLLGRPGIASNIEEASLHGVMNYPIGMGRGVVRGLGFKGRIRGPQTVGQGLGYAATYPGAWAARRIAWPVARYAGPRIAGGAIGAAAYGGGVAAGAAVGAASTAGRLGLVAAGMAHMGYRAASRVLTPAGMIWGATALGGAAMIGGGVLRAELSSWAPIDMRKNPSSARFQNSTYGLTESLADRARPR